jgi:HEAT repeat protein
LVRALEHISLADADADVRRSAASGLREFRDPDALDDALSLLDRGAG